MMHKNKRGDNSAVESSVKRQKQGPRVQKYKERFDSSAAALSDEIEDILKINSRLHTHHFALIVVRDSTYSDRCITAAVRSMNYQQQKCLEISSPSDWKTIEFEDTDLVVFRNPFGSKSYDKEKAVAMIAALVGIQLSTDQGHKPVTDVIIVTCKAHLEECKENFHHDLLNEAIFLHDVTKDICDSDAGTSDHVYKNLLDELREEDNENQNPLEAQNVLNAQNFVVISGGSRSGKNALALKLIPEDKVANVLVLTEVEELKYVKFGKTFAVIIKDIGGKQPFDQTEALKWCRKFDMMFAAAKRGKIRIIITVDKLVLKSWLETLAIHRILEHVVHLSQDAGPAVLEIDEESEVVVKQEIPDDEGIIAESMETVSTELSDPREHPNSQVKAILYGTFDVTLSTDKKPCDIWDICRLFNGLHIMTDFRNNSIKKMDQSYKVTDFLNVPGKPIGVCQVDKGNIAVALWDKKRILFVSLNERMTLSEKSFDVDGNCSGIACTEDLLYVSCGGKGNQGSSTKGTLGHVEVFDFFGTQIAKYYDGFCCPEYLYFNTDSSKIHITDAYNGLIVEKHSGVFETQKSYGTDLDSPAGMCSVGGDKLCVAGYSSNNVVLVKENGHTQQLLSLEKPAGLCFDSECSRLIVTMAESNDLKVYDLSFE